MTAQRDLRLDTIDAAVAAVRRGELVVVVDDTDRENEGDLVMAASTATTERMAFMIRHTSGIVCAPMSAERAERLSLPPMVANNLDPLRTAFTVSVDHKLDLTTGISAEERARTVRFLAADDARPGDFLRPGHVFPLIGRAGGVLTRSGHTEAAIDLARLAGLPEVAVLAEVVNDDGTVKRMGDLVDFAKKHGLTIVTIEDLIAARVSRERLVQRLQSERTTFDGHPVVAHAFSTSLDPWQHLAVIYGELGDGIDVPCRIYRGQPAKELLAQPQQSVLRSDFATFEREGRGAFVLLRGPEVMPSTQPHAEDAEEAHGSAQTRKRRWREIGVGAQILNELGISSIALLADQEWSYVGLAGHGIQIARHLDTSA